MNLETFFTGVVMITLTVVGFFYVLKLQDKWIDKILGNRDDDGSLRV